MRKYLLLTLLAAACYIIPKNMLNVRTGGVSAAAVMPVSVAATGSGATHLTRSNFEAVLKDMYGATGLRDYHLDYEIFRLALIGYYSLEAEGRLNDTGLLTIIDFSAPSTEKRFYTIDLIQRKVRYHSYVAHGRNTGENIAKSFSNIPESNQSSLGFYVTGETYVGSKGYSLRLDGIERGVNDNMRSRAVVIHAADYATDSWIKKYGRLGRSQGCPALPPDISREVIDTIKDRSAIFTYYPDLDYLNTSAYLRLEKLLAELDRNPRPLPTTHLKLVKS